MKPSPIDQTPESMRPSCIAYSIFLALTLFALSFLSVPFQGIRGILWTGVGALMLLLPPIVRVPRAWAICIWGFILLSLVGFLPREWFAVSPWRAEVEALGTATGSTSYIHPLLAADGAAGFIFTALTALYLMGHRIHARCQQYLMLAFCIVMAIWVTIALIVHKDGDTFGFFPNYNHTASIIALSVFIGLGGIAQAVRHRKMVFVALHTPCVLLSLWVLFTVSISRAGIIMVGLGIILWFLLSGRRSLRGNTGKAIVLLVFAAVGSFFLVESKVKNRLTETAAKWSETDPLNPEDDSAKGITRDARYVIMKDTVQMIRSEAWTGVGPRQFQYVFPQYLNETMSDPYKPSFHPESDWLQMISEVGLPAVISLIVGLSLVVIFVIRNLKNGKGRLLKIGCLIAALLLLAHGIFDVPGHCGSISFAGILFLCLSLQEIDRLEKSGWRNSSSISRASWRVLGGALFVSGATLIVCQATGKSVTPQSQYETFLKKAEQLIAADKKALTEAISQGKTYNPEPSECPLEAATLELEQALRLAPADARIHQLHGYIAVHFNYKQELAGKSFRLYQRLDPIDPAVCITQATYLTDIDQVMELCKMGLERAKRLDVHNSDSYHNSKYTFQQLIRAIHPMSDFKDRFERALNLAGDDHILQVTWAQRVPQSEVDRLIPELISRNKNSDQQYELFHVWQSRGSKNLAEEFAAKNPQWNLGQK